MNETQRFEKYVDGILSVSTTTGSLLHSRDEIRKNLQFCFFMDYLSASQFDWYSQYLGDRYDYYYWRLAKGERNENRK